ncbi:uncharacterized protein TNCV_3803331 [Trichonephila clavipes]|nr:uncharacterized protein TNCV_3803331 [Trichonephila clavipes]
MFLITYIRVSQDYWDTFYGEVGDITRIQICITTHGRKRLRSSLGGVVCKSTGGNRPTLPQPFKLSSLTEKWNISQVSRWADISGVTENIWSPLQSQFTCRNCGGGDRGRVAIYRPFGEVSLSLNRTVTCMVLKANDRRTSCPCHDEFRGPCSDYVRQVALATTTTNGKHCLEHLIMIFACLHSF